MIERLKSFASFEINGVYTKYEHEAVHNTETLIFLHNKLVGCKQFVDTWQL